MKRLMSKGKFPFAETFDNKIFLSNKELDTNNVWYGVLKDVEYEIVDGILYIEATKNSGTFVSGAMTNFELVYEIEAEQ